MTGTKSVRMDKDEWMGVEAFAWGVDFYYVFLKGVTAE
jgi:hypothetical protein